MKEIALGLILFAMFLSFVWRAYNIGYKNGELHQLKQEEKRIKKLFKEKKP